MVEDLWIAEVNYIKWSLNKDGESYGGEHHIRYLLIKAKNQFEAYKLAIDEMDVENEQIRQWSNIDSYLTIESIKVEPFDVPDQYNTLVGVCDVVVW